MAGNRFYGPVGFGESREEPAGSGVWTKVYRERKFYGDVIRSTRRLDDSDKVNNDVSVGTSISIVAKEESYGGIMNALYLRWKGVYWVIEDVEVLPNQPRLLLRLGGVYDGPRAPEVTPSEVSSDTP